MKKETEVLVQTACICLVRYLHAASEQKAVNSGEWRIWRYCADDISEINKECTKTLENFMEQGRAAAETDGDER